jgi:hypothetical protein
MRQQFILMSMFLLILAGCMTAADPARINEQRSTARIRVYQQADAMLYPGEYCYGSKSPRAIRASETGFSIFGSSKRAGMPVTGDIPGAYNEFVIEAGKPLTVMLKLAFERDGVKSICGPLGSTFFPQAGKNYDITMLNSADKCMVQVRELYEISPGKAVAQLTPVSPSFFCGRN